MQADRKQREANDVGQQDCNVAVGNQRHTNQQHHPDQCHGPRRRRERRHRIGGNALYRLWLAEQAIGPRHQHQRHDQELDDERELGERDLQAEPVDGADANAEGLGNTDDDRRQERAADAAQPPHYGDYEGIGDDRKVEIEIGWLARNLQSAAQSRQHRSDEEHGGEELCLVNTQRAHHLAVLGGGPHQRTPARARQQQPQHAQHHGTDGDQQQVVGRDTLAKDLHGHGKTRSARAHQILGTPDEQRDVLDHQYDSEGRQQLEQFGSPVDAA